MFRRWTWTFVKCFFSLTLLSGIAYGSEDAQGPQPLPEGATEFSAPPIEDILAACRAAKTAFRPLTEADLAEAKEELSAAVARLDARLKTAGPVGNAWRAFLDWNAMQEQLARDAGPELAALDALYAKYAGGNNGLELAWFADVRRALRRYLTTARSIGNPEIQKQYEALLDALPEHLEAYHSDPDADRAGLIGAAVRWLEEAGQAADLVGAIRGYFSHPNLFLQLSAGLIDAGIAGPVAEKGPMTDVILGARISGTEHVVGRTYVELLPNEEYGEITTVFRGTVDSETVGAKGPARVSSEGVTKVASRKTLRINAGGIWTLPARSRAITSTTFESIRTVRGGRLIEQMARRQAYTQKGQAERVAAQHAEQRSGRRVDEQGDPQIAELADAYQEKLRRPLIERKLFPQLLRFRTTEAALHATARHGGLPGLGASVPPPALEGDYDLVVRLHESLVNNFMEAALAGAIVEEETVRTRVEELFGSVPAWLEPDEESEPWTITFAGRDPLSVAFRDGGFTVTMRGREYAQGANSYPGMNVTAAYLVQPSGEGFKAVRQGDLQIFPPGFAPGTGRRLSARQQVLRSLLEKRFGKIFPEEMVPEPLVLPGDWKKAGELDLKKWDISGGWLTEAWTRTPAPADTAPPATPAAE